MGVPTARSRTPSPTRQYHTTSSSKINDHPSPRQSRYFSDPSPPLYENIRVEYVDGEAQFQLMETANENVAPETEVKNVERDSPPPPPPRDDVLNAPAARDLSSYASIPVNFEPDTRGRQDSVDLPPLDPNLVCPVCSKQFRVGRIQDFRSHYQNCQKNRF